MSIWNWLHISAAYLIYLLIAILTSIVIRKTSGDLRDFSVRNSPRVLLLGGAANLIALFAVLSLLIFWDKRSITALGLSFSKVDIAVTISGFIVTFFLAILFLLFLKQTNHIHSLDIVRPANSLGQIISMLVGFVVLVTIVLQEEVLNRGYVTLNLLSSSPPGIILISTTIFVLIHLLTNRANLYQLISWIVSGLVLIISYLLSGTIWVPVILHYATDAANTLVFNITGQFSFFKISPLMTEGQRAIFRVLYGPIVIMLLVLIYGAKFKLLD